MAKSRSSISKLKKPALIILLSDLRKLSNEDQRSTISPLSLQKYKSGFHSFAKFCLLFGLPFVPNKRNLCDFVLYLSRVMSPRSVRVYLSGIQHIFKLDFPSVLCETFHQDVKDTMKSCIKKFSKPVVRKLALTVEQIELVVSKSSSSYDSLLGIGFGGLHCLGELTIPDSSKYFDPRKIILRSSLWFLLCKKFVQYNLPYSKGDSNYIGAPVIIHGFSNTSACPILRDKDFISSPGLFITSNGSLPTRNWFMSRFRSHFDKSFSGHSLRSGGATALAQSGHTMHYIKSAGCWSSDAFLIYVRGHVALRLPENQNHVIGNVAHIGSKVTFS
ncbi:hypothetical protein DFH28DRAFT_984839 [Melampsora americana]|nr:hypothetical protein DFH28DRAFT_984839 [Melampsora americana]